MKNIFKKLECQQIESNLFTPLYREIPQQQMIPIFKQVEQKQFIPVDEWIPEEEDNIIKHTKGAMIIPISQFAQIYDNDHSLNYFLLSPKRCYANIHLREHFAQYLNYFLKFYDEDKELLSIYYRIKYLIDYEKGYDKSALAYDIHRYILSGSILYKLSLMNRDNYSCDLDATTIKNESLKYTNKHGMILMKISLLMIVIIPILTHFIYVNKLSNVKDVLLEFFDPLLDMFDSDIYMKLFETASSKIEKNVYSNPIWNNQDIRAVNPTTHIIDTVTNIILHVIPKYKYSGNVVSLNFSAIDYGIIYQVTDIGYEYDYIPVSSSNRDEDNNSEFDKFESYLIKQDESLYLQNKVNCETTMASLEQLYGPFDDEEIQFYKKELSVDNEFVINSFQMELAFNPFYKYFGDPVSIKDINSDDYIKLLLIARKMLEANGLKILPYIISGKPVRIITRKRVNKKESLKLESSPQYTNIINKYRSEKVINNIIPIIATIISSEFKIIDFHDPEFHGQNIEYPVELLCKEIMEYIDLV